MNFKLVLKSALYFLILLVMGANGVWHLALLLSPPKTSMGLGLWYWLYLVVFPALTILGIAALGLKKVLNLSWWIGALPLLYIGILTFLIFGSYSLGFAGMLDAFPGGGFKIIHVIIFIVTLLKLISVMQKH